MPRDYPTARGRQCRANSMRNRARQLVMWMPPAVRARAPNDAPEQRSSPPRPQRRTALLAFIGWPRTCELNSSSSRPETPMMAGAPVPIVQWVAAGTRSTWTIAFFE